MMFSQIYNGTNDILKHWPTHWCIKLSIQCIMGVAVAIFSFRFQVLYFPVSYRLTVSYLTKHENQIFFHIVKQEVNFCGKKSQKNLISANNHLCKVDYDIYFHRHG